MAKYHTVQHSAQAEVDDIVGRDRMPTATDESQLQYVRSVIKEVSPLRHSLAFMLIVYIY